jgi:hypothetical protein
MMLMTIERTSCHPASENWRKEKGRRWRTVVIVDLSWMISARGTYNVDNNRCLDLGGFRLAWSDEDIFILSDNLSHKSLLDKRSLLDHGWGSGEASADNREEGWRTHLAWLTVVSVAMG